VEITAKFRYQIPNARPRPLEDGAVLHSGDRYSIFFEPRQKAHVYVYQVDSRGVVFPFFPNPDFSELKNPVPAGQAVWVPSAEWSFELDDNAGTEELVVVASRIPLREVESVFNTLLAEQKLTAEPRGSGSGTGRERKTLTMEAGSTTLALALDILASPGLGAVKRVKFLHK
jgi:hypothetical protein